MERRHYCPYCIRGHTKTGTAQKKIATTTCRRRTPRGGAGAADSPSETPPPSHTQSDLFQEIYCNYQDLPSIYHTCAKICWFRCGETACVFSPTNRQRISNDNKKHESKRQQHRNNMYTHKIIISIREKMTRTTRTRRKSEEPKQQ
jgi:hypothetical protein